MSNTLKIDIPESFDFSLIAIVSSEPIYRLSWLLNLHLKIGLKENQPIQMYHPKGKIIQEFERFSQLTEQSLQQIDLIQNRSLQGFLSEEHRNVDFWLKLESRGGQTNQLVDTIKKIQNISLAFEVNPGSLKSKDRFLFSSGEIV